MNKSRRNLGTGIYILALLLLSSSCKKNTPEQKGAGGPVPVGMQPVHVAVASYFDAYPANVVALHEVQLRSEVSGFITGISFREGQQVRKGQRLYEIERVRYEANYSKAVAGVSMAEANLEKTEKDVKRYEMLAAKEAIARQRLDYSKADLVNAQQQLATAKATLRQAALDLQHSVINAPFEGTIGISTVKQGTYVTAGQTIMNTLSSEDPMAIDFVISEKEIPRFMTLRDQTFKDSDSVFTILLPDKSVYPYTGQIETFDRAVDPQTGTLRVRLRFPNPKHVLKAGMSCDVRVLNNTGRKVIQVPFKAVTEQMSEFFVYVVENDTARQRKVTISSPIGSDVIVFSGLTPEDKVVVEGIQKLRDGVAVQTGTQAPPAGTPAKK